MEVENREQLILDNIGLVKKLVNSALNRFDIPKGLEKEDLMSIGIIAMIQAVDTYDPSKGVLDKWISRCVYSSIIDEIKKERNRSNMFFNMDTTKL